MTDAAIVTRPKDTGVACLSLMARNLGISPDSGEVVGSEKRGDADIDKDNLIRMAQMLGLDAHLVTTTWKRLQRIPLPAIACLEDGSFMIAAQLTGGKMIAQHPVRGRPYLLTEAEFNCLWNGQIILVKPAKTGRSFDFKRLLTPMFRYNAARGASDRSAA